MVKVNHYGKYQGQRSFHSTVIVRTHTHVDKHTHKRTMDHAAWNKRYDDDDDDDDDDTDSNMPTSYTGF